MKQRIITALITLAAFIPIIVFGNWVMNVTLAALAVIALLELLYMRKIPVLSLPSILSSVGVATLVLAKPEASGGLSSVSEKTLLLLIFSLLMYTVFSQNVFSFDDAAVSVLGMIYIGAGFRSFLIIRQTNIQLLLLILFVVWSTDTFAYFVGRQFGKNKLAPVISPNKTIEGSVGGTVAALLVAAVYLSFISFTPSYLYMLSMMGVLSIVGQLGDLTESALKRYFGVKDSGKILPGHGGILDRFDSLIFAMTFAVLLNLM